MNVADVVVLSIIVLICTLIVRGMLHGTIRTCDEGSCGGNCAGCNGVCTVPRLKLSDAQLAQLRDLSERAGGNA